MKSLYPILERLRWLRSRFDWAEADNEAMNAGDALDECIADISAHLDAIPVRLEPTEKGYRYHLTLQGVCLAISGFHDGSAPDLPADDLAHYVKWLTWRLDNWQPGFPFKAPIDEIWKQLCVKTLRLHDENTQGSPFEDPHPALTTRTERRLLTVVKMAYRKHVCGDESIGWDELGDRLAAEICNAIGSDEFCKWNDANN
jgi:hypothetical protein